MEFTGKIIAILPQRGGVSKSGNEWKVQEYVIEDHGQYPRRMCFDVFGADKIEQFNIQMGEELTVSFESSARAASIIMPAIDKIGTSIIIRKIDTAPRVLYKNLNILLLSPYVYLKRPISFNLSSHPASSL